MKKRMDKEKLWLYIILALLVGLIIGYVIGYFVVAGITGAITVKTPAEQCDDYCKEKIDEGYFDEEIDTYITEEPASICGDAICDNSETVTSCPEDCLYGLPSGPVGPVCGDNVCDADEDCYSCSDDCGDCYAGGPEMPEPPGMV
jgi:hypothetical protein